MGPVIPDFEWGVLDDAMGVLMLEVKANKDMMDEMDNPNNPQPDETPMSLDTW